MGFEQQCSTVQEQECSTSYEQQCSTSYEQQCSTSYEQQCTTVNERECSTSYEQECSTTYEQECTESGYGKQECHQVPESLVDRFLGSLVNKFPRRTAETPQDKAASRFQGSPATKF